MNAAQSLKIYEILHQRFGDAQQAREVVQAIESVVDEKTEQKLSVFESTFRKDLELLRSEMRVEIKELKAEMLKEMKEQKAEMIKWMFIFWIGQLGATIAVVMLFLKK